MDGAAASLAEAVARRSYGRLVAYLVGRTRDLAAAEDALAEAFRAALETWPRDGVPRSPEAWLLTVARRAHGARERAAMRAAAAAPEIARAIDEAGARAVEEADMRFPDHRLKLLFVCAHPAIDPGVHTPLMLQTVLGLDAARIAAAFLVPPATMSQRLVRAKAKIKAARIRFATPEPPDLPERLGAVCEAIFGAYGAGWDEIGAADPRRRDLAAEAVFLARTLVELMPEGPEAKGLLAALLYSEARAGARRGPGGRVRAAGGAGHRALGSRSDRRGGPAAGAGRRGGPLRPVPVHGGDPGGARGPRRDRANRRRGARPALRGAGVLQPDGRGSRRPRRRPGRGARPGRRAGASRRAAAGARGGLPALLGGAGQPADAARRRRAGAGCLPHGDQADDRPCGAGLPRRRTPSGRRSGVGLLRLPCSRPGDALGGPATRQFRGLFKRFPVGLLFRAARGFRC